MDSKKIKKVLNEAVELARNNTEGKVADYIPELASVSEELLGVTLQTLDGALYSAGDMMDTIITLQSVAKAVLLVGMLEEFGLKSVSQWVRVEPSGDDFSSVARLDQFGPVPYNPMLNSGAIALSSHIPGVDEEKYVWLETWMEKLFGDVLSINPKVFASERRTGARNRSLAYLLQSNGQIKGNVESILEHYFALCSFEVTLEQASRMPMILSNGGKHPKDGQVISKETALITNSIMATCGLYNETGTHMVKTGLPAKSGVSGMILAVSPGRCGIAVASPRVNRKGTSMRSAIMLEYISKALELHFANQ